MDSAFTLNSSVLLGLLNNVGATMAKITAWFTGLSWWQPASVPENHTALPPADGAHLLETINAIGGLYGIEFIHH